MNTNSLSIGDMATALGGAGLSQIQTNLTIALLLIGVAVTLKVMVAYLNKNDISISATPPELG